MFFAVVGEGKTWRNAAYLLLGFPLGLCYFIFLVVGLSLGFGLIILVFGIPLLAGVFIAAYALGEFERLITNPMLDLDIPKANRWVSAGNLWSNVRALFVSPEMWKRVGYLLAKFPLGIVGLTLTAITGAFLGMVATPVFYEQSWWPTFFDWPAGVWEVDSLGEAVVVALVGLVVGVALLHVINWVARAWAEFAKVMLAPTDRAGAGAAREMETTTV